MARIQDAHHHGRGHSHSHPDLHDPYHIDAEEGALVVLEQRRKFKASLKKMKGKYEELEDTMFDDRRPPLLRTAGGEVLQGVYPPTSRKWLGVAPRFGSEVPQEKYVGAQANALSKWISTDKVERLKGEASVYDQSVRSYLRIDDSIDVHKMTGSHFRFIDGFDFQDDDARVDPIELANRKRQQAFLEMEDQASGSLEDGSEEWDGDEEEEEEEEDQSDEDAIVPYGTPRMDQKEKDAKALKNLDRIFQRHCSKLSSDVRKEIATKMEVVENNWRSGQATRPATLRFRR